MKGVEEIMLQVLFDKNLTSYARQTQMFFSSLRSSPFAWSPPLSQREALGQDMSLRSCSRTTWIGKSRWDAMPNFGAGQAAALGSCVLWCSIFLCWGFPLVELVVLTLAVTVLCMPSVSPPLRLSGKNKAAA